MKRSLVIASIFIFLIYSSFAYADYSLQIDNSGAVGDWNSINPVGAGVEGNGEKFINYSGTVGTKFNLSVIEVRCKNNSVSSLGFYINIYEMYNSLTPNKIVANSSDMLESDCSRTAIADGVWTAKNVTFPSGVILDNNKNYSYAAFLVGDVGQFYFGGSAGNTFDNGTIVSVDSPAWNTLAGDQRFRVWSYEGTIGIANTLNISDPLPSSNSFFSTPTIRFNVTGNFTNNVSVGNSNCSIYINTTYNQSLVFNGTTNKYIEYNLTFPFVETAYTFYINCTDNTSSEKTSTNTFFMNFINFTVSYSNFNTSITNNNYSRVLNYSVNLSVCLNSSNLYLFINNVSTNLYTCNGTAAFINGNYTHSLEGAYNITFKVNYSNIFEYSQNKTFISDLYNPTPYLNFSFNEGFYNNLINVSMRCYDNVYPNLTYTLYLNSYLINSSVNKNNLTLISSSGITNGVNTLLGYCADPFGNESATQTQTIYFREIVLINEKNNSYFDVRNLTSVILYYDDNSTSYNFKDINATGINFTSAYTNKLRLELKYSSGETITRYVDTSISNGTLRICANTDPTTHYQQLVVSATQRKVSVKNVFSNCVVGEDYTRFAYQDALILKVFTIDSLYYLYTYDGLTKVYLASLDGSISTYYNIDTLEFKQQQLNLNIVGQNLAFDKSGTTLRIYYINSDNDSVSTNISIYQANNSQLVFTSIETTTPNTFYMYFDYSTLNVSNTTLFKIIATKTTADGLKESISAYFNGQGSSGWLTSGFVFVISILITVFGLTFVIARTALGWFGLIIQIISIAILSLAPSTWYTLLMMAINFVILIFIGILFTQQNYGDVT